MEGASKFFGACCSRRRSARLQGRAIAVVMSLLLAAALLPIACSSDSEEGPPAPEGFTATPGTEEITLTWDVDDTVDSYNLYWATAPAATEGRTLEEDVSSPFTHTGLTSGTRYYYVLTAVAGSKESLPTDEVTTIAK